MFYLLDFYDTDLTSGKIRYEITICNHCNQWQLCLVYNVRLKCCLMAGDFWKQQLMS